jgi:cysteine desulfurase
MDPEVLTAMTPLLLTTGNPSSTHAHGREVRSAIETARKGIAKCLGALPSEIYFTSGGTESDNTAIFGAIKAYNITHIISTTIEHHAVTHPIEHLEKEGLKVTWLSLDALGHIDLAELEQALATNERSLVCLMHGNNEIGTLLDMKAVGEICKAHNALFFCDTVQTVGHLPINLAETQVHFISGAAHKFYGPKGVGFLFVRKGLHIPSLVQGGAQERSMRAGTENPAGIVGMAFALEKCCAHLPEKTLSRSCKRISPT